MRTNVQSCQWRCWTTNSHFSTSSTGKKLNLSRCCCYLRPVRSVLNPSSVWHALLLSSLLQCVMWREAMCSENPPPPLSTMACFPSSSSSPLPCRGGLCGLSGAAATFPTSLAPIGETRPLSLVALPPPGLLVFHWGAAVQFGGEGGGSHCGVYQLLAMLICYQCHVYVAKLFEFVLLSLLRDYHLHNTKSQ